MEKKRVFTVDYDSWQDSVDRLLRGAGLGVALRGKKRVLIKPNLVEALQPPVTTPVSLVGAIITFLQREVPGLEIMIGEGSGSLDYETAHTFQALGYVEMAAEKEIALLDLNEAEVVRLEKEGCNRWPEMHLPEILFDVFLISVPVLKAHTLAGVTLTMKNMMGTAPPEYYQQGGHWKKASFHENIQEAVFDLNRYRTPDFSILDATVGMCEAHLRGATCSPPPNTIAASFDPVAIDAYGTGLLNRHWRDIGHIALGHGTLGLAEPLDISPL